MNQELKKVTAWLTANKLSLNINKTNFIIFKSNRKKLRNKANVIINEHTIDQVKYTKFLGIYIDEELSWKYHINHIASKISKMTGIMAKARHHLTSKTLLTLYHTMIYPYLNYCNNIWGSTYPTRLLSIFKTQKKIVRIMTFSNYNDDTRPLFESLKILNIHQLNTYLRAVFMYSYYHDKLPAFFNNFFITNNALHSHNTRSVSQIHIEFNRTNYGKFSIRYRGAIVWNSLPSEIRNINFYNLFKKSLKLYVQKNDT